ncbi:MAG: hypothetical protein CL470_06480 [Acidimicrobiaceae bacterium]|nr:hypothetical protein [Acidimicrobiaceae bacterium]
MSSPETFIAFAAIMFVIALIGAAIDWFGAPLRHRKFVPKAYRFPDERIFRNESARGPISGTFQPNPANPYLLEASIVAEKSLESQNLDHLLPPATESPIHDEAKKDIAKAIEELFPMKEETTTSNLNKVKSIDYQSHEVQTNLETPPKPSGTLRLRGWTPGGYIFNLTQEGKEPSSATVKNRYWKNVSAASGSAIFGSENIKRMKEGKPPQRRNYRNGKIETMRISPKSFDESNGEIPIPYWPSTGLDPFGSVE